MSSQSPFQNQSNHPKKQPVISHDSILESLRDIGSGVKQGLTQDAVGQSAQDAFASLFGQMPKSYAEKRPRNPFEKNPLERETPQPVTRPEILSPARISQEQAMVKQQIEAVRQELAALAKSIGQLNTEVEHAVSAIPVDPGVYHLSFFERLRSTLMLIRKRVNDSNSWLQMSNARKKQKGYWGSYKKHGTKFGLSADRNVATQTG